MVCIFCIAVLAIVAGALTASSLDDMEGQLADKASGGVKRVSDTESVTRFELSVDVSGKEAPVAVTVYKEHGRARIQVLTHALTPEEVQKLEDELAEAIGAKVVDRSNPQAEGADHEHEHNAPPARADADRVLAADATEQPERQREPERQHEPEPEPPRR